MLWIKRSNSDDIIPRSSNKTPSLKTLDTNKNRSSIKTAKKNKVKIPSITKWINPIIDEEEVSTKKVWVHWNEARTWKTIFSAYAMSTKRSKTRADFTLKESAKLLHFKSIAKAISCITVAINAIK